MTMTTRICATALLTSAVPLAVGAGAHAAHDSDEEVRYTGTCSAGSQWEVRAKTDDGRIEIEAEVDGYRSSQTWRWVLRHNASRSARGTSATTRGSGSFSIERTTVDFAGADSFIFRAAANPGGETCVARLVI